MRLTFQHFLDKEKQQRHKGPVYFSVPWHSKLVDPPDKIMQALRPARIRIRPESAMDMDQERWRKHHPKSKFFRTHFIIETLDTSNPQKTIVHFMESGTAPDPFEGWANLYTLHISRKKGRWYIEKVRYTGSFG